MASSDEEGELLPTFVTKYYLEDETNQPVSLSALPLQWTMEEPIDNRSPPVYLYGSYDNDLQSIYKRVIAWKYELVFPQPVISVLLKGKQWIQLETPRKCFEQMVRTILLTIDFLHYVKKNPEASEDDTWTHLSQIWSSLDVPPCESDVMQHLGLVRDACTTDKNLARSQYLTDLLSGNPRKRKQLIQDEEPVKKPYVVEIVAEDVVKEEAEDFIIDPESSGDAGEAEEDEYYDTCCAICDDGGDIICCEGRCMRSFHATIGFRPSQCKSLGYYQAQLDVLRDALPNFLCKNCQHKQHQCSICGKLGSSNESYGAEVFPCVSATCGRFYHPNCVAKALHQDNEKNQVKFEEQVASGDSFMCPAHECFVCGHGENREDHDLQFAVCRRCPKAYHRKCLPRNIYFETNHEKGIFQRAWDGLLPKRILIYCRDHKIVPSLATPKREHIVFPGETTQKAKVSHEHGPAKRHLIKIPKKLLWLPEAAQRGTNVPNKGARTAVSFKIKPKKIVKTDFDSLMEREARNHLFQSSKHHGKILKKSAPASSMSKENRLVQRTLKSEPNQNAAAAAAYKINQDQIEDRINALIEEVNSSLTLDDIKAKQKLPSSYSYTASGDAWDKNVTIGKIDAAIKAIQTAAKKIDDGCSIEEAMAVCEPNVLLQLQRWKRKYDTYLAPFLLGPRYSSFGRHFTKVEKLIEIVNRLHWYVKEGDMIVDFSCGSNDFSCLLSNKLQSTGKTCQYRNYDLFQTKNNFNFEKKDWFTVTKEELSPGSQLIIGLNPPFGYNAGLANKFINRALQFMPKLLILTVPKEAQRLDNKNYQYDLIWQDDYILTGKSFYLPGSVDDKNQQQEQWNIIPPPLFLWSRRDWTRTHLEIARNCGHLPPLAAEPSGMTWSPILY